MHSNVILFAQSAIKINRKKKKAPQRQTYQTNVQKDESNQPIAKWPVELELRNPPPVHSQNAPASNDSARPSISFLFFWLTRRQ